MAQLMQNRDENIKPKRKAPEPSKIKMEMQKAVRNYPSSNRETQRKNRQDALANKTRQQFEAAFGKKGNKNEAFRQDIAKRRAR